MNASSLKNICALKSFADPRLSGLTLGLNIKGRDLDIDPKFFSCCEGRGLYTIDDHTLANCDLKWRLLAAQNLLIKYQRYTGRDRFQFFHELAQYRVGTDFDVFKKLHDFLYKNNNYALVMKKESQSTSLDSNIIWKYAFAAIWRLGLNCHIVRLGKTPASMLIPIIKKLDKRETVILVENIHTLDNPSHAFDFESIVSFAYKSCCKLLIEVIDKSKEATVFPKNENYFAKKISNLKSKPQLSFIQADCLSKLKSLTGENL